MFVCRHCGNKRCPHATDHRLSCTGSNEPGQEGSSYGTPLKGFSERVLKSAADQRDAERVAEIERLKGRERQLLGFVETCAGLRGENPLTAALVKAAHTVLDKLAKMERP